MLTKYYSKELGYTVLLAAKGEKVYITDSTPVYWPNCLHVIKWLKQKGSNVAFVHEAKRCLKLGELEVIPWFHEAPELLPKEKKIKRSNEWWDSVEKLSPKQTALLKRANAPARRRSAL